jgi:hypothetical protein
MSWQRGKPWIRFYGNKHKMQNTDSIIKKMKEAVLFVESESRLQVPYKDLYRDLLFQWMNYILAIIGKKVLFYINKTWREICI